MSNGDGSPLAMTAMTSRGHVVSWVNSSTTLRGKGSYRIPDALFPPLSNTQSLVSVSPSARRQNVASADEGAPSSLFARSSPLLLRGSLS